jgi:inosine/guanosine/xanthosine phosphorylase family protein
VLMLAGRAHYYEKGDASVMRPVIAALADLGIEMLILTNAAGSVRHDLVPGSVMLIDDHINYSGLNPLIGEPSDQRFVGMTAAYDKKLKDALTIAAGEVGEMLAPGVYMWFSGPSFETPAEIRMARTLGADAVGMSTVPEVILARFFGLRVAACSVITKRRRTPAENHPGAGSGDRLGDVVAPGNYPPQTRRTNAGCGGHNRLCQCHEFRCDHRGPSCGICHGGVLQRYET